MGDRMTSATPLEICNVATLVKFVNQPPVIFMLNQFMVDENLEQTESLFNPHQAKAHHVRIDDTAKSQVRVDETPGEQKSVIEGNSFPFHFDGFKMFHSIRRPTREEHESLPKCELTSPLPFEPQNG